MMCAWGKRLVCGGKWCLHYTLLCSHSPINTPKDMLQPPESQVSKTQTSKCSETHQGKCTSSRGPGPQRNRWRPRRSRALVFNDSEKIQEGWAGWGRWKIWSITNEQGWVRWLERARWELLKAKLTRQCHAGVRDRRLQKGMRVSYKVPEGKAVWEDSFG